MGQGEGCPLDSVKGHSVCSKGGKLANANLGKGSGRIASCAKGANGSVGGLRGIKLTPNPDSAPKRTLNPIIQQPVARTKAMPSSHTITPPYTIRSKAPLTSPSVAAPALLVPPLSKTPRRIVNYVTLHYTQSFYQQKTSVT